MSADSGYYTGGMNEEMYSRLNHEGKEIERLQVENIDRFILI